MDLPADPLDEIENPVEPPIMPGMDMYADPLCRALDDLERTIEDQQVLNSPVFDPMDEVLDNLERETEQQSNLPSISGQVLPAQDVVNSEAGDHDIQGEGISGPKSITPPAPDLEETPATKQYSVPVPRMRGHSGSRVRNTKDDSGRYCYLYETWVTDGCDESCQDFEQDEYTPEDEEKRCKHSFFRLNQN